MSHQSQKLNFYVNLRAAATALAIVFALVFFATPTAQAQTYQVIYNFDDLIGPGEGGSNPMAGVTIDAAGNLYGTTSVGGELLVLRYRV